MADQIDPALFQELARLGASLSQLAGAAGGTASAVSSVGNQFRGTIGSVGTGMMKLRAEMDRGRIDYKEAGQSLRYLQDQFDELDESVRKSEHGLSILAEQQRMAGQLLLQGASETATEMAKAGLGAAVNYYKNQVITGAQMVQSNAGGMATAFALQKKSLDDVLDGLNKVASAATTGGAALASLPNPLAQVIGRLTIFGSELTKFLGEIYIGFQKAKLDILERESAKTIETFKAITTVGALFANGITEMRESSREAQLDIVEYGKIIAANQNELAKFGGTVTGGIKKFTQVSSALDKYRTELLNLGFTYEEQAQASIDYLAGLQKAGTLLGKAFDPASLAQGTADYLKNLRAIAAFTGEDVRRAEQRAAAIAEEAAVQREFQRVGGDVALKFKDLIKMFPPGLELGIAQFFTKGVIADQKAALYFSQMPAQMDMLRKATALAKNSSVGMTQASELMQNEFRNSAVAIREQSARVSDAFGTTSLFLQQNGELAAMGIETNRRANQALVQGASNTVDELKNAGRKVGEGGDPLTNSMSAAQIEFQRFAVQLNLLTTGPLLEFADKAPELVAKSLVKFQNILNAATTLEEQVNQSRESKRGGAGGTPSEMPGTGLFHAKGGIANKPSIFGEAGPEAAVPLPDGKTIPVTINYDGATFNESFLNMQSKQLSDAFAAAVAEINRIKVAQNDTSVTPTMSVELATTLSTALESAFNSPTELTRVMQTVRDQIANDSKEQLSALQTQLDKLDQLVTAMQNNVYVSERIANELA